MHHSLSNWLATRNSIVIASIICGLAASCASIAPGTDGPPVFSSSAGGDGNEVKVNPSEGPVVIEVLSESGIGSGTVELVSGTPPQTLTVRLYLSGLEQFRLHHDATVVNVSVSSGNGGRVSESLLLPDGAEREISSLSPQWMAVRIVTAEDTSSVTPGRRYYEVDLPRGLLQSGSHTFSFEWVDFFR